jgi:predicted nuclease with TOPRIM domain
MNEYFFEKKLIMSEIKMLESEYDRIQAQIDILENSKREIIAKGKRKIDKLESLSEKYDIQWSCYDPQKAQQMEKG